MQITELANVDRSEYSYEGDLRIGRAFELYCPSADGACEGVFLVTSMDGQGAIAQCDYCGRAVAVETQMGESENTIKIATRAGWFEVA